MYLKLVYTYLKQVYIYLKQTYIYLKQVYIYSMKDCPGKNDQLCFFLKTLIWIKQSNTAIINMPAVYTANAVECNNSSP